MFITRSIVQRVSHTGPGQSDRKVMRITLDRIGVLFKYTSRGIIRGEKYNEKRIYTWTHNFRSSECVCVFVCDTLHYRIHNNANASTVNTIG